MTIVGVRRIAPHWSNICEYGANQEFIRISLMGKDSVESLTRRGRSAGNTPVALGVTSGTAF
jgi:hypothetical protein